MTTINDINDLARILREQPEWVDTLRSLLLTQELLDLPERFAEFTRLTEANFQLVHERIAGLETRMGGVETRLASLETRMGGVETRLASLETRVGGLETRLAGLEVRVGGLETSVAQLQEGQARLEIQVARLAGEVGNLTGSEYEKQAERLGPRRLRQQLGITGATVIHSVTNANQPHLTALLDQAMDQGILSLAETEDLEQADLVFQGQDPAGNLCQVLVEASITIQEQDVERARRRADLLARLNDAPTLPAVIGAVISPMAQTLADGEQVTCI